MELLKVVEALRLLTQEEPKAIYPKNHFMISVPARVIQTDMPAPKLGR